VSSNNVTLLVSVTVIILDGADVISNDATFDVSVTEVVLSTGAVSVPMTRPVSAADLI
jgi:hypothetical protein